MTRKKSLPYTKKAKGLPGSLIAYLPLYYVKAARQYLGNLKCSNSHIESVAKGRRNNTTIREALAWVALELFFNQMFTK